MKTLNLQQKIIDQMQLIEALSHEFNQAKKRLIDAKRELIRLQKLMQTSEN